jgi:hypothetical protein
MAKAGAFDGLLAGCRQRRPRPPAMLPPIGHEVDARVGSTPHVARSTLEPTRHVGREVNH